MITKVRSRIQDAVDAVVAAALTVAGITMVIGYGQAQAIVRTLETVGALAWAGGLTLAGVCALVGVGLRVSGTDRRRSTGYQLELVGWGFLATCVGLYTIMNTWAGGSAPGIAALIALTALLAGKFLRGWKAIGTAQRMDDS